MKIFSRALLAFILAATAAPMAMAALTSVSGNVYDVGKYSFSRDDSLVYHFGDEDIYIGPYQDSAMCWAAAASNILQRWQDTYLQYADSGENPTSGFESTTYDIPTGTGALKIYNQLLKDWTAGSGVPYNPIAWWLQGRPNNNATNNIYYPSSSKLKDANMYSGGYYNNVFGAYNNVNHKTPSYPSLKNAAFFSSQVAEHGNNPDLATSYNNTISAIRKAFETEGQAVTLSVQSSVGGTGHAISCWGYETDANGNISLILSDSDDRMYGTFMVTLSNETVSEADGNNTVTHDVAIIQDDRYNSWYYGSYVIKDVTYIDTPATTVDGNTQVASANAGATVVNTLSTKVTDSCQLGTSVSLTQALSVGGGTYDGINTKAVLFTSSETAGISIHDTSAGLNQAQLCIKDGAMALLYNGISISGQGANQTGGIEADGHLYVHGGDVSVSDCTATRSGAGIYATDFNGKGIYASTFVEVKGAGDVTIARNTSNLNAVDQGDDYDHFCIGGGGIAAEDSFSISGNKAVSLNENKATGHNVYGGAALATNQAAINGNESVAFTGNSVIGDGNVSEGGATAALFTEINDNGSVSFTGNSVTLNNSNSDVYYTKADKMWDGAHAQGGAIAVTFTNGLTSGVEYIKAQLNMSNNGDISFSNNSVTATYTAATYTRNAEACGGALYVGNLTTSTNETVGSKASLSDNLGNITFGGNQASSASVRNGVQNGSAQGGAIYVAKTAELVINDNAGTVSFVANTTDGNAVSQGGAIYNEGSLSLQGNQEIQFKDNKAINGQGDHLYNAENGVVDISGNQHVSFSSVAASSVVNKGNMYLTSAEGGRIDFHNTTLKTENGGVTRIGKSADGATGSSTLLFTDSTNKSTSIQAIQDEADFSKLSISTSEIMGAGSNATLLKGVSIETTANMQIQMLTLKSDVGISGDTTMSRVVIDFTGESYSIVETELGKCYVYDLDNMACGALTLNNVTFKSSLTQLDNYDSSKDWIVFNFGSDTTITLGEDSTVTLAANDISAPYKTAMGGAVYFGENVNPPDINVPEPATGILALVGLAGLAGRRRRK